MLRFLDRSRLALAAGIGLVSIIGTTKHVSIPLYQAMYEWEGVALCLFIPFVYFLLHKFDIS